jgi:hypothetical protein
MAILLKVLWADLGLLTPFLQSSCSNIALQVIGFVVQWCLGETNLLLEGPVHHS